MTKEMKKFKVKEIYFSCNGVGSNAPPNAGVIAPIYILEDDTILYPIYHNSLGFIGWNENKDYKGNIKK
jgi:hypothetical protein